MVYRTMVIIVYLLLLNISFLVPIPPANIIPFLIIILIQLFFHSILLGSMTKTFLFSKYQSIVNDNPSLIFVFDFHLTFLDIFLLFKHTSKSCPRSIFNKFNFTLIPYSDTFFFIILNNDLIKSKFFIFLFDPTL